MKLLDHVKAMCCRALVVIILTPGVFAQKSEDPFSEPFHEGCCVNHSFPRPRNVSASSVSAGRLQAALSCATNNRFVGGTRQLAKELGDRTSLHVAYYYGTYMPEQNGAVLTAAVYSADGKHGFLFDIDWESSGYFVDNLPDLLKASRHWRVGEINGGLWSYTRLWYLAQEIGSRPRLTIPIAAIERAKPTACFVLMKDQTNWKPDNSVGH